MNDSKSKVDILYEDAVKSTNDNRIKLIEDTIHFFSEHDFGIQIDHYEFYLILDEAISNAMEHGNRWVVDKLVRLKILRTGESDVEIYIKDEGEGFNPENIPVKSNDIQSLSSRGRGIIIIKKFCEVSWNETGNEIRLFLPFHRSSGAK